MTQLKLKVGGRFKIILLVLASVACTDADERVRTVGEEAYVAPTCWFDAGGEFNAFLVLARNSEEQVPYPVSGQCLVQLNRQSLRLSTLRQLGAVEIIDRDGTLQREFPGAAMSTNVATHQLMPALNSRVYYFRAHVRAVPMSGNPVYSPDQILQLDDANITFERFLELTAAERERLWYARRRGS